MAVRGGGSKLNDISGVRALMVVSARAVADSGYGSRGRCGEAGLLCRSSRGSTAPAPLRLVAARPTTGAWCSHTSSEACRVHTSRSLPSAGVIARAAITSQTCQNSQVEELAIFIFLADV